MPATDLQRLTAAFIGLRARGWWARWDLATGWDAVPDDVLKRDGKVLFWHANETPKAFGDDGALRGPLHLQHKHRDANEVLCEVVGAGLRGRIAGPITEPLVVVEPGSVV